LFILFDGLIVYFHGYSVKINGTDELSELLRLLIDRVDLESRLVQ